MENQKLGETGQNVTNWNEIFEYRDGELYWKIRRHSIKIGTLAGYFCGGYRAVRFKGLQFYSHRIIYEMHFGKIPEGFEIDHIDTNPLNNKVENLRVATRSDNVRNIKTPSHNTSGVKGVYWNKDAKKWCAQIGVEGKRKFIGYFSNIEDAAIAYNKKALALFGEFAYQNRLTNE